MTQERADQLISMHKHCINTKVSHNFPSEKERLIIPLLSDDKREEFSMSVYRGRIDFGKCNYNILYAPYPLVRVDLGHNVHTNPDGGKIQCPHIHIYKEGYELKWAYPLPPLFKNPDDLIITLSNFMDYCNIITRPEILGCWDMYT